MDQELKSALFAAESVAHLRGFEREILPLADLARGQANRIEELELAFDLLIAEYKTGADSGEWGNWEFEDQEMVKRVREIRARRTAAIQPEAF
jgi:hypothetical protein